jgi:glycosyltransferase involved in cell wall biosynthesis
LKDIYTINDIEILISTMNRDSLDFLMPMFPFSHFSNFLILIINQTIEGKELISGYSNIRVINSFQKGLSKSRNLALENAVGKICVIADDDVVYQEGFLFRIINAYNNFPEATVINFCAINSQGELMKKYSAKSKINLNIFDIFNTSSIEMTLNQKLLDTVRNRFDMNFGLGGNFEMGEEAIFLIDLKKQNKQLVFVSEIIVKHEAQTSSNKKNLIEKYYIQGALLTKIFRRNYIFWLIIKLFFDLKQGKVKLINLSTVIKSANQGHKEYQRIKNK